MGVEDPRHRAVRRPYRTVGFRIQGGGLPVGGAVDPEIGYLVDINPHRKGRFVPGTGKEIVGPEFLAEYQPDLVIAMNPIYRAEIARDLERLGCRNAVLCARRAHGRTFGRRRRRAARLSAR